MEPQFPPDVCKTVSRFLQQRLPTEWNVAALLIHRVLHPDLVILVPVHLKTLKLPTQVLSGWRSWACNTEDWLVTHVSSMLIVSLCHRLITSSSLCCSISTEPLRGPPRRRCCLPVLQRCHRSRLCYHGDLQACTNQAWQVHTGELLFILYIRGGFGKVRVVRKRRRADAPLF